MPDCTSPAPFMSKVVRVTPGATVHARQVVTVAAHPASVDGSAGLALLESDAAPGHGGPLAKVREVLERLAEVGHPMGTGGRTAAQGLAALAPLERALPELLDTYHIANLHQHGPGRATWEGCSKCTALLEGTTP